MRRLPDTVFVSYFSDCDTAENRLYYDPVNYTFRDERAGFNNGCRYNVTQVKLMRIKFKPRVYTRAYLEDKTQDIWDGGEELE